MYPYADKGLGFFSSREIEKLSVMDDLSCEDVITSMDPLPSAEMVKHRMFQSLFHKSLQVIEESFLVLSREDEP